MFGYEEALGYAVGDVVRDKDGFGAALAMLRLAEEAKSADRSVLDVYDDLERTYGVHLTSQLTLRTADQARVMSRLRAAPPDAFGGEPVAGLTDLAEGAGDVPRADVLIFRLAGGRVANQRNRTEDHATSRSPRGRVLAGGGPRPRRSADPLRIALEELLVYG